MIQGWNELIEDLPDEVETMRALETAVLAGDGTVEPAPDGARILRGSGATRMVIPTGDNSAFPAAMQMHSGWVVLPACGNPAEFSSWLAPNGRSQTALPDQAPAGWDLLPAEDGLQLARTDASLAGWPTTATLHIKGDLAVIRVEQPLPLAAGSASAAIAHLLALAAAQPPVNLRLATPPTPNDASGHAPSGARVIYEVQLPASLLTSPRLGAALAAIAGRYLHLAPVCEALAGEPFLVSAYQTMHQTQRAIAGSQSTH